MTYRAAIESWERDTGRVAETVSVLSTRGMPKAMLVIKSAGKTYCVFVPRETK